MSNSPPSQTEDRLMAGALAALDSPTPEPAGTTDCGPTLAALDTSRRPSARTVCEGCPNSVWFASPVELKCYCRVMFLVSWSTKEPNQITACDGIFLGQE